MGEELEHGSRGLGAEWSCGETALSGVGRGHGKTWVGVGSINLLGVIFDFFADETEDTADNVANCEFAGLSFGEFATDFADLADNLVDMIPFCSRDDSHEKVGGSYGTVSRSPDLTAFEEAVDGIRYNSNRAGSRDTDEMRCSTMAGTWLASILVMDLTKESRLGGPPTGTARATIV